MGMEGPPPGRKLATSAGRLNPHPFIVAQFNIARASLARVTARMLTEKPDIGSFIRLVTL